MKNILILSFLVLAATNAFALDLKGKIIEAAKDKENQKKAIEYAQKGVEYIKGDKKEEVKEEVSSAPIASSVSEKAPSKSKTIKKTKTKKTKEVKNT
jgi:hypothetical protein